MLVLFTNAEASQITPGVICTFLKLECEFGGDEGNEEEVGKFRCSMEWRRKSTRERLKGKTFRNGQYRID